jgi:PAS domain S-box-containing protein
VCGGILFKRLQKSAIAEASAWVVVIGATVFTVLYFPWYSARTILDYILIAGSIGAIYFYLKNQRLIAKIEGQNKELTQKQREINNRQETIDLLFEHSADGILIINDEQQIEEFSPGMERMTGYSKTEALGRDVGQLLKFRSSEETSLLPDLMFTANTIRKNPYIKNFVITKDGREITVEASYTLVRDPKGANRGLAVIRDITYEKELIERDKEFIAVTSHQLNTPLSIIRGYSSLLLSGKSGKINKEQSAYVQEIHNATEKMVALIQSLLSISRIEQEKIKLNLDECNLLDLITKTAISYTDKAKINNVRIELPKTDKNLIATLDQEKIGQVLSNLLDNAIKYSPKGKVTISIEEKPQDVIINVADTGIGISESEIEKIGTRFYRTQSAINLDHQGTGLGLFIAKTIVEKHGGHLNIVSKPKRGTTISIILPKKQNDTI